MSTNQSVKAAWDHLAGLPRPTLAELFAGDADRLGKLSTRFELGDGLGGIRFDWSKMHLDDAHIAGFEALAAAQDFDGRRAQLFGGEKMKLRNTATITTSLIRKTKKFSSCFSGLAPGLVAGSAWLIFAHP